MPPLDTAVTVEQQLEPEEDGRPKLDTFHGFHDAKKIVDGDLPEIEDSEVVTVAGAPVDSNDAPEGDVGDPRHTFLTHRGVLSYGIDPCTSHFPWYTTDRRIEREWGDDGLLTESGVEDVMLKLSTRYDLGFDWTVGLFHDSYTSMLYRIRTVRKYVGSAGGRLRVSYMPIRRCGYALFEQAMIAEPSITRASKPRSVQPDELLAVRGRFGGDTPRTQVVHEHRITGTADMRLSILHEPENPFCGYERDSLL